MHVCLNGSTLCRGIFPIADVVITAVLDCSRRILGRLLWTFRIAWSIDFHLPIHTTLRFMPVSDIDQTSSSPDFWQHIRRCPSLQRTFGAYSMSVNREVYQAYQLENGNVTHQTHSPRPDLNTGNACKRRVV